MTQPLAPLHQTGSLTGSRNEILAGPAKFYADTAQRHGGIARFRVLRRIIHTISDPDLAHEVLVTRRELYPKTPSLYRNAAQVLGLGLITLPQGQQWTEDRRVIQPGLHRSALAGLVDIVVRAANAGFEKVALQRDAQSVVPAIRAISLQVISESLLGTTLEAVQSGRLSENFLAATQLLTRKNWKGLPLDERWPTPLNRRLRELRFRTMAFLEEQVDRRLAEGVGSRGDMLDLLLSAEAPGAEPRLDRERILNEMLTLYAAGFDTTSSSLSWAIYYLSERPDLVEQLAAEADAVFGGRDPVWEDVAKLEFAECVFNEALRLRPPVHSIGRSNIRDDVLGGYRIPAGSSLLIAMNGVHRSPRDWEDPEAFLPDRFSRKWNPRAFIPFAAGPRRCLGALYAMVEAKLILALLARRFRLALQPGSNVETSVAAAQYPENLFVRFEPRIQA